MFILTEKTPNPHALKLKPDCGLTDGDSWAADRRQPLAGRSPLADRFLALTWVDRVFIGPDFVTVTRVPSEADWTVLRPEAILVLADFLASGLPALLPATSPGPAAANSEIEEEIQAVIARYLQPGVARDGGEIRFARFEAATGVLWIEMRGACGGCPSSRLTLKGSVETTVRRFVPEVLRVEEVAPAPPRANAAPRWQALIDGVRGASATPGARTRFTHNGQERQLQASDPALAAQGDEIGTGGDKGADRG